MILKGDRLLPPAYVQVKKILHPCHPSSISSCDQKFPHELNPQNRSRCCQCEIFAQTRLVTKCQRYSERHAQCGHKNYICRGQIFPPSPKFLEVTMSPHGYLKLLLGKFFPDERTWKCLFFSHQTSFDRFHAYTDPLPQCAAHWR